jgi:hypothetical protein
MIPSNRQVLENKHIIGILLHGAAKKRSSKNEG